MNKPKISVTIRTVSKDNLLMSHGIKSAFEMYIDCLKQQTFKDFEFVYVDYYYNKNKNNFDNIIKKCNFVVKHVPIHENHKYWEKRGYTFGSAMSNTAILYADGELFIAFDDAEVFPLDLLAKYWYYYKYCNAFLQGSHKRISSIDMFDGKIIYPINGTITEIDSRLENMNKEGLFYNYGSWFYAGSSARTKDLININGFDEKLDGIQEGQDTNIGLRLEHLKYTFAIDKKIWFGIIDHDSYSAIKSKNGYIDEIKQKCNYGSIRLVRELKQYVANTRFLNSKEIKIYDEETLKYTGKNINFSEPWVDSWLNVNNFNLKNEAAQLRRSREWKW